MSFLRDPNLPPLKAIEVEVMHGHIQHEQDTYSYVTDVHTEAISPLPSRTVFDPEDLWDGNRSTVELVAEARKEHETIAASYRCRPAGKSFVRPVYLSTTSLHEALLSSLRIGYSHIEICYHDIDVDPGPSRWPLSISSRKPEEGPPSFNRRIWN